MTDKQYAIYRAKGTKIYKIRIFKRKFILEEQRTEKFDDSFVPRRWLNESIVYNSHDGSQHIYATEDKIEECKKKLYNYIKEEYEVKLKQAKEKLENIEKLGEQLFGGQ